MFLGIRHPHVQYGRTHAPLSVRRVGVLSLKTTILFPRLGTGKTEQWALSISTLTCISPRTTHGYFRQGRIPGLNTHRPASAANVPAAHYKPPNRKCSG